MEKINKRSKSKIGTLLQVYRFVNQMGVREMAEELGVSTATISRIENGQNMDGKTMVKIFTWLFGEA